MHDLRGLACRLSALFGIMLVPCLGSAQQDERPSPDAVLQDFLERGTVSSYSPSLVFEGDCDLRDSWSREVFEVLATRVRAHERLDDLASAWAGPLWACGQPDLITWYDESLRRIVSEGGTDRELTSHWVALREARHDGVRTLLRALLTDDQLPDDVRSSAGFAFFPQLDEAGRRHEFIALYSTHRLPDGFAGVHASHVARENRALFLSEVADAIRQRPSAVWQYGTYGVIEAAQHHNAPREAVMELVEALEDALEAAGTPSPAMEKGIAMVVASLRRRGCR